MPLPNPRHEKFAQATAQGRHLNQAYEAAGFSARGTSARCCAARLRYEPEVVARIAEIREEAMADHRARLRKFLDYLVDVIQTPAGHVQEGDRLCISYRATARHRTTRMPDKLKAAELLARLCGWFASEKPQPSGPVEVIVTIAPPPGTTEEAPKSREPMLELEDGTETEGTPEPESTALQNLRHERFAIGIAAGKRPPQAYLEAGFTVTAESAYNKSWRLMRNPAVQARIAELQREADAECSMSRQQLLDFLMAVMMTPAGVVTENDRLCQSFHYSGQMRHLRIPDKMKAAELVARIEGWHDPERFEHSFPQDRVIRIGGDEGR